MMNKLIVEATETNIIDLDVKVHNDSVTIRDSDVMVRMTVEGDNNCSYSFAGYKNGDSYSISVPRLKGIIPVGERNCLIEVVCFDRYFKAWEGKLEIREETRVEVSPRKKEVLEQTQVEVTPTVKKVSKTSKQQDVEKTQPVEKTKKTTKSKSVTESNGFEIVMDETLKRRLAKRKRDRRRRKQ